MLEVVMAAYGIHSVPAVAFKNLDYLAGFHSIPS